MANEMTVCNTAAELYTPSQYSTLQVTDSETRKAVVNAMNNAESLAQHEDEILHVMGVITRPGIRRARGANQQDMPCTNTTIVCADGKAYMSQSEGVRNAVDNFLAADLFADGEIIDMKLVSSTLPNNNTRKTLVLV